MWGVFLPCVACLSGRSRWDIMVCHSSPVMTPLVPAVREGEGGGTSRALLEEAWGKDISTSWMKA